MCGVSAIGSGRKKGSKLYKRATADQGRKRSNYYSLHRKERESVEEEAVGKINLCEAKRMADEKKMEEIFLRQKGKKASI